MGRRWGKSVLGSVISLATSVNKGKVAWIAPTYKNTRPLWRVVEATLASIEKVGLCTIRRAEKTVEFINGGFLGLYSADNPTSILGEWFHVVVVDEAARIAEQVWTDTIQPTLADADGDAILISTPKGKNWFFKEWQRGQEELKRNPQTKTVASWIAPTKDNPNPRIKEAYRKAEHLVSSRTYKQEWNAQFIDDGGEVFRLPQQTKTAIWQDQAQWGHTYVFGIDTAPVKDYNAICVIDCMINELVYVDRFNGVEINLIINRIVGLASRFNPSAILIEENGAHAIVQALQRQNLPVLPFKTTNASKAILVDKLSLALETAALKIVDYKELVDELNSIESTTLPGGSIRYAAPSGQNDDCFMACGLALYASENVDQLNALCATTEIADTGLLIVSGKNQNTLISFAELRDIGFISTNNGYYSICRVWLDKEGNRHVIECWRRKTHVADAINNLYRLHQKRAFESVGIEQKLYDQLENEFIQIAEQNKDIALPIYPIELDTNRQQRQVTAIQSPIATQRVTVSLFIQRQGHIWGQIFNFSSVEDDARDAIAGALILAEQSY